MRSTLFLIPFEAGGVPIFGFGILLAVWAIGCAVTLAWVVRTHGLGRQVAEYVPAMALVGALIFFLPKVFADYGGMPVRGYGVMVVLGATAGIGLAAGRARRMGLDPDTIVSVCFWMIVAGIVGARFFYVVQYWDRDFYAPTFFETVKLVVNYTYGGLVIYGAILGGAAACLWYTFRYKLPTLAIADLIMPGVMVGIAFGRLGCFLHGCCYGGACDQPWAVTFPAGSPPYERQVAIGQIDTIDLAARSDGRTTIRSVPPGSPAAIAGLRGGDVLTSVNGLPIGDAEHAIGSISTVIASGDQVTLGTERGAFTIAAGVLPPRSRPVHPTQLYSAIHAGALAFLVWNAFPYRRRDGQVLALLMLLYPIGRFLLEVVRTDEPGRFGTDLTISQWISVLIFVSGVILWVILRVRCAKPALPPATEAVVAS